MTISVRILLSRLSGFLRRFRATKAKGSIDSGLMRPPIVMWPTDVDDQTQAMACPNCGSDVPKPLLLTIDFTTSPGSRKETAVLRCPGCTCPFYASQTPPDYTEDAMLERGRVPFYLQQGAGLSLITRPLAQLRSPAGSVYAEVGCGFGFGLDYAHHAKGWTGQGIDPGGISTLGQAILGVPIDRRYLADSEPALEAKCDVVMASETIEHVPSPHRFVCVLRSMLRPGGTLILTTPDGADLRPETAPGVLIGLLSPGLHLIFQTRESLRRTLIQAGFGHVVINKDGHSLVAFASDQPLNLELDASILRSEYRAYLEQRAAGFSLDHDLCLGFAGRAFQEAVNDAAFDQARRVQIQIERACIARFRLPLDVIGKRADEHVGASLEDLSKCMPLNLGGLLYADCMLRMASGAPRSSLGKNFLQAAAAADLLRIALAGLAMADGMSEEIAWTARAEAVLCSAAAGANDVLQELSALPPAPDAESGAMRRDVITERVLVELVNAGHYELATELTEVAALNSKPWADCDAATPRSASQRDGLFCLAVLDSQRNETPLIERSLARFSCIRQMLQTANGPGGPDGLFEAALRGETAALERLGGHEDVAVSCDASSKPTGG